MKRAIVTGGAGFIGSHLVELLLSNGWAVTVVDNLCTGDRQNIPPGANWIEVDVATAPPDCCGLGRYDALFHLAGLAAIGPSMQRPADYMRTNVQGTVQMLEVARRVGAKVVYAASSCCYGRPTQLPTSETAFTHLDHPYALSKQMGEDAAFHWGRVFGVPVVSLRMFDVYGPRIRAGAFPVFLRQKIKGEPFTVVGNGEQTRDFVHVRDVARAYLLAAESDVRDDVFNVGFGRETTINRLLDLLGGAERVTLPERPWEPTRHWADIRKIQRVLGWEPEVRIEDGIAALVAELPR